MGYVWLGGLCDALPPVAVFGVLWTSETLHSTLFQVLVYELQGAHHLGTVRRSRFVPGRVGELKGVHHLGRFFHFSERR